MDILAPVLAYLTCVAGIIGAFVVSVYVVFSPPSQPAIAQRTAAIVSASTAKATPQADAKKPVLRGTVANNSSVNHVASTTQKREEAPQAAAAKSMRAATSQASASAATPQKSAINEPSSKRKITRAQWRQIVQQERKRRLAYQQDADFEARFLGYAD